MKLVSNISEVSALRNLCHRDVVVSGTFLSGVDESYFHNEWTKEAFNRIQTINRTTGKLPMWSSVLEDPKLSEKVRAKLKDSKPIRYRNREESLRAIEVLNTYRQLRGCYDLSDRIVSTIRKDHVDVSALLDKIAEKVSQLRQNRSVENDVLIFGKGNNSQQFVKDMLNEDNQDFLPTGFDDFDNENGGIGFGNLFVLGGSTGGGKSTLAAQLGINWADMGETVTMVPLEMSKKEMTARLMANAASIDVRKILFGKMSDGEKKKYLKAYRRFVINKKKKGGSFRVFKPSSDMTIQEILAAVYPFGSRVVIIDYISLLKDVDGDDAWQKLGAVARYCKVYAEAHNMIIVLLAQVSDEGVIRYARAIAEHANYAWKFVASDATREHEIINIDQLKARNGRMFPFTLRALLAYMQIRNLEIEEKEQIESVMSTGKKKFKGKKGKPASGSSSDSDSSEGKKKVSSKAEPNYLKDLGEEDE